MNKKSREYKRIEREYEWYRQGQCDVLFTLQEIYGEKFMDDFMSKAKELGVEFKPAKITKEDIKSYKYYMKSGKNTAICYMDFAKMQGLIK